jgi:outer membrane receptor protein involved in Fe transport
MRNSFRLSLSKKFFLIFLCMGCLPALSSQAQESFVPVSGTILSSDNKPIAGVAVIADNLAGTQSDSAGHFLIRLTPEKHLLIFRLLGFEEQRKEISLAGKTQEILSIRLAEAAHELGVVVVTAGRHEQKIEDVTVSMEVVRPALVQNTNATNMETVIDQVPGVNVVDGQASIRGGAGWSYGAGSRVQILVDDIPQLSGDAGDAKWSFIATENLEQVEVIKGASSVLFGSAALNGVINFRTAFPKDKPETRVTLHSGFYDNPKLILGDTAYNPKWWGSSLQMISGMNFLHSQRFGNFDLVLGGNVLIDDGYRQGEDEHRFRFNANTRWRTKTEGLSLGVNFNIQKSTGAYLFIWQDDTTGSYLPAANSLSDYTLYKTSIDPYLTYVNKEGGIHKFRSRYFNNTNQNNTNQNSTSIVYFAEYQYQHSLPDQNTVLTGGVSEQYSTVKSELYHDHDGNNLAAYVQGDTKLGKFNVSAGARVEQNRTDNYSDDPQVVVRAGLNYHLFAATYLRSSIGQGYRFPSIAEQYVSTTVGAFGIYPNDSLSPEKGVSMEIGVKQGLHIGSWHGYADVAFFINRYENMMEFAFARWGAFTDPGYGLGFASVNVGNTEIKGAEFSISGTGAIAKDLQLDVLAGYTFIDPRQTSLNDYYVKKVLPENALGSDSSDFLKYRYSHLARIDAEITRHKTSFGISGRYNSFMVNIDKIFETAVPGIQHYRTNRPDGDLVFDSRLRYAFNQHWTASFICKNVFNYIFMQRPADMQAPRTFVLQVNFSL